MTTTRGETAPDESRSGDATGVHRSFDAVDVRFEEPRVGSRCEPKRLLAELSSGLCLLNPRAPARYSLMPRAESALQRISVSVPENV
jgi:hypothetical protein